jgi:hypothetical protein
MTLVDKIKSIYPSLTANDFDSIGGSIALQNDSDGKGDYIKFWGHPTLPRPTDEELA